MSGPEKTQLNGATHNKDDSAGVFAMSLFAAGVSLYISLLVGWLIVPEVLYAEKHQPIDFSHAIHVGQEEMECTDCHVFRDDGTYAGTPNNSQCIDCHDDTVNMEEPELGDENYEYLKRMYDSEVMLVEEYLANDREVPWLTYAKQPDCVFFSHAAHMFSDKFKSPVDGKIHTDEYVDPDEEEEDTRCNVCHMAMIDGEAVPFGEAEKLPVYQVNRLTKYSRDIWGRDISGFNDHYYDSAKMDDCAQCHYEQRNHGKGNDACFVCHK